MSARSSLDFATLVSTARFEPGLALIRCAGSCGCGGHHRITRNKKTGRLQCDCQGYQRWWYSKPDFRCKHLKAALIAIAQTVLVIEGNPTPLMIESALSKIQENIEFLKERYLAGDHCAPRYGYNSDSVCPITSTVGLSKEARQRDLTRTEKEACAYVLSSWQFPTASVEAA